MKKLTNGLDSNAIFKQILLITFIILSLTSKLFSNTEESEKLNQVSIFVEKVGNDVVLIAKDKSLSSTKKKEKIVSVIDSAVDSQWIARFVLGKNFKLLNDQQKQNFFKLYRQFMVNTYAPKFNGYNGKSFKVKSVEKQNIFFVTKSEFMPLDSNTAILIDFRVRDNNKLSIVDFIVEGVSLIETQRSEFNSTINDKGVEKFMSEFEQKVTNMH